MDRYRTCSGFRQGSGEEVCNIGYIYTAKKDPQQRISEIRSTDLDLQGSCYRDKNSSVGVWARAKAWTLKSGEWDRSPGSILSLNVYPAIVSHMV